MVLASKKASNELLKKMATNISSNVHTEGHMKPNGLNTCIALKDVSVGYEEEKYVLKDINMSFEAGKSYAIVGGSGSGKSTLLNLLAGGFEQYQGEILYDSNELLDIHSDS